MDCALLGWRLFVAALTGAIGGLASWSAGIAAERRFLSRHVGMNRIPGLRRASDGVKADRRRPVPVSVNPATVAVQDWADTIATLIGSLVWGSSAAVTIVLIGPMIGVRMQAIEDVALWSWLGGFGPTGLYMLARHISGVRHALSVLIDGEHEGHSKMHRAHPDRDLP